MENTPTPPSTPMPSTVPPAPSLPTAAPRSNKLWLIVGGIIIVAVLLAVGIKLATKSKPTTTLSAAPAIHKVLITATGFDPATLTVPVNSVVEWDSNDATTTHVVAADPYPSHSELPGLVSGQLGKGAKYQYTFATAGTYTYHDDLKPTTTGTIVVK